MEYAITALAVLGFLLGVVFRLNVLLLVLAVLLVASVIFAIGHGYGIADAFLTIIAAQTAVQVGYFLGVLARSCFVRNGRMHQIL